MDFKLKDNGNGDVNFIAQAGSDYVRSAMPIGKAQGICASAEIEISDKFDGFPILADGKFFEGKITSERTEEETPVEEPKNDKNFKNKWKK